ncbi:cytochrome P450 [Mycena capillaripes]|nr:cytochrome P450 [Mycena capillaripes]
MPSFLLSLYFLLLSISAYISYRVLKRIHRIYSSSLRSLPGPPSLGFFYGSVSLVPEADAYRLFERWTNQWGPTFRYSSIFNASIYFKGKALTHILSSDHYVKSNILTRFSPAFSRKIMVISSPPVKNTLAHSHIKGSAFSYAQIREFTHVFSTKSLELRDLWMAKISQSRRTDGKMEIDAFAWMNRLALDTIGLAGFDYDFDSLHATAPNSEPNELLQAVRDLFTFDFFTVAFIVQLFFPLTRLIPTAHSRTTGAAVATIRRIGNDMITQKKSVMLAHRNGPAVKHELEGSDLLSLLIKPNLAIDLPAEERMTDEEILSQIPSVLLAGHEVREPATVTWTLFALATNPAVQTKLRTELRSVKTEKPTMDMLMSFPYLDAVLRESLRLHAPVGFTERIATKTDYIPLHTQYVDVNGTSKSTTRVDKGDKVYIPIRAVNRSKDLWGLDAEEFKPERWRDNLVPDTVKAVPAVWSNTMSFLAGPHACIGYRVALIQMKAMLFTLIRDFEFELAISPEDVGRRNNIVGRPYIASDPGSGSQLPMLIRPCKVENDDK